jgi:D-alanine--poly(phosphoribitol) ligase subunit 1
MYKTGDLVKWDNNKQLIFIGRKDDQIKLRGIRIELSDIQHHLMQSPFVRNTHVLCVNKNHHSQTLIAFIIPHNHDEPIASSELTSFLTDYLPPYMIPSKFISLKKFPLKNNGKIDTEELILIAQAS